MQDASELYLVIYPAYETRNYRHKARCYFGSSKIIGPNAVSVGLQAGKSAYCCLAALEQNRGLVLGFIIDCRSTENLQALKKANPGLYYKLNNLRSSLDLSTQILEGDSRNTTLTT